MSLEDAYAETICNRTEPCPDCCWLAHKLVEALYEWLDGEGLTFAAWHEIATERETAACAAHEQLEPSSPDWLAWPSPDRLATP